MENFYTWAILDNNSIKQDDYIFGSDLNLLLEHRKNENPIRYEYNQAAQYETRNYCTVYSAFTMLSHLMNKEFTDEEIIWVGKQMENDWKLDPSVWAYLSDAIDYVRKYWNTNNPNDKILSFRIKVWSIEFNEATLKGYSIQVWYKTSKELYNDSQDDWIVSAKDFTWNWWHAVTHYMDKHYIIDNYKWKKKYNRYKIQYFDELLKDGTIFNYGYLFLKEKVLSFNIINMWKYEKVFKLWESKWQCQIVSDIDWYVNEYVSALWEKAKDLAYFNLIMFNRLSKK